MTIAIKTDIDYTLQLSHLKKNIINISNIDKEYAIKRKHLNQIYQILNNNELKLVCRNILKKKYLESLSYNDLANLYEILESFMHNIEQVKRNIDVDIFFEQGNIINIRKLKIKFKKFSMDKKHPHFNFKRLKELYENPPKELLPLDRSSTTPITYDPYIVRKYLHGIIQMVINEMDLLLGFVGEEGMGKSLAASQDMNLIYYLLKELRLITYDYKIEDMWFNSLHDYIAAEDKYFAEKFRILGLDEGNELNRQDWQNDEVKTFFQRLRRERYNQRIKIICLPQLGELLSPIVLSRMNFIFKMYSRDDFETHTLDKGYCDFHIIPRSEKIYSPHQKRNISREEIKKSLTTNLEDKKLKYISQLPQNTLIKRFRRNHIWGFGKDDYEKKLKDTNKTFTVSKGIKVTEQMAYCYYVARPKLKDWKTNRKDEPEIYSMIAKLDNQISSMFTKDPDKLKKWENHYANLKRRKK
jgi:hypothetical protein